MTLLADVVTLLEKERVAFAVVGASALAVHGVPRSTYDVDLLTTSARVLDDAFWSVLTNGGCAVDVRRGDDLDPLHGVVRVTQDDQRTVDIIVGRHAWQSAAIDRAQSARVLDVAVPVVDVPDLILLKLYAGGPQDSWDIEQLVASAEPGVVEDVDGRATALPAESRARWNEIRGHA